MPSSNDSGHDEGSASTPKPEKPVPSVSGPLAQSGLGSGLLAKQPTPTPEEVRSVARVCPQCGGEYDTTDRFCPKDGTPLRPKAAGDPLIGRVIADRYLILALIGEGGMGRVYLAEHVKMNRQCAIKVMNPALIHDEESHQRFAREASNAARILHPNVAAVFDYGEADNVVYLVMEYVEGESIATIVARDGALEPRRAIDIARQVADGLQAAHELGIVHRDLKPDNIIVTRNKAGREVPKVVDFGIAKAVSDSREDGLTQSGLVIGTPEFMSPEQLLGDPVDARSDIYSLGCILFQMLTGKPAFAAESREQMIRRRLHEAPPHIRDVVATLPRRLDTTIVHMLARSSKDRLPSAAQAREMLDPALVLGGWNSAANVTVPMTAAMGPYRDDPSLQPTVPMPQVHGQTRKLAIAGASVAVAVSAVLVFMNYHRSEHTQAGTALTTLRPESLPVVVTPTRVDSSLVMPPAMAADTGAAAMADKAASTVAKLAKPETTPPAPTSPASTPPAATPRRREAPASHVRNAATAAAAAGVSNDFLRPVQPLADAIQSKDIKQVDREFPAMTDAQRRTFTGLFEQAKSASLRVTPSSGDMAVNNGRATGPVTIDVVYTDPQLNPRTVSLRYIAVLDQRGSRWVLKSLTTAPGA